MIPERITFTTDDGVVIVGDWYPGTKFGRAVLLLHMMPETRDSWRVFAERLASAGVSALAIDERGHGESTKGPKGPIDFRAFSDREQREKIIDVRAALDWLKERGFAEAGIAVVGASIGANLAIAFAAENREIPAVIALSPGLDYRGVTTEDRVAALRPEQKILLVASAEDERSFVACRALRNLRPDADILEFEHAGHGTRMFDAQPDLMDDLIVWLKSAVMDL